jgi:hypothetical protein
MALRVSFQPLRPDLDNFLFAAVGAEQDGIPLSMLSALTRLGLDPWDEAGRLSSLSKREAVEQLARLIAELPGACRPLPEAREIAGALIERLPKYDSDRAAPPVRARRRRRWPMMPRQSQFWMFCLVFGAAALFSIILHGFPFGMGSP